jgi:transposase InsO family protein
VKRIESASITKVALAVSLGVSRSTLYYIGKQDKKDWALKCQVEIVLREHPAYGSRNLSIALETSRERMQRVMRKYGIKPYRRRGRKWRKKKAISTTFPNVLLSQGIIPSYRHHVWAADFTELLFKEKLIYVATVIDLYSRETVGVAVGIRKGTVLVTQALCAALLHHPRPTIFHSDNGTEYAAKAFIALLQELGITISRSHPGCPWENGYQESFYGKFKVDLGDPNRFKTLGELVAEVYLTVWKYNNTRIHSALKMPPITFIKKMALQPSSHALTSLRLAV